MRSIHQRVDRHRVVVAQAGRVGAAAAVVQDADAVAVQPADDRAGWRWGRSRCCSRRAGRPAFRPAWFCERSSRASPGVPGRRDQVGCAQRVAGDGDLLQRGGLRRATEMKDARNVNPATPMAPRRKGEVMKERNSLNRCRDGIGPAGTPAKASRPEPEDGNSARRRRAARLEQRHPAGECFALEEIESGRRQDERQHDQRHANGGRPMAQLVVEAALRIAILMVGEQRGHRAEQAPGRCLRSGRCLRRGRCLRVREPRRVDHAVHQPERRREPQRQREHAGDVGGSTRTH